MGTFYHFLTFLYGSILPCPAFFGEHQRPNVGKHPVRQALPAHVEDGHTSTTIKRLDDNGQRNQRKHYQFKVGWLYPTISYNFNVNWMVANDIDDVTITYYHLASCHRWMMFQSFVPRATREWSKMEPIGTSPNLRSSETLNKRTTRSMSSNSLLRRVEDQNQDLGMT